MSLRNHFYIKLYVNDIVSDEKLNECSAEANGVYFRLIFFLHRQKEYGCFTIVQEKELSAKGFISVFSNRMLKHMPFTIDEIERGVTQLHEHDVIQIESNRLSQKRMVKDNDISEKRSGAGKIGGTTLQKILRSPSEIIDEKKEMAKDIFFQLSGSKEWLTSTSKALDLPFDEKKNDQWVTKKIHSFLKLEIAKVGSTRESGEVIDHFINWARTEASKDPLISKHLLVNKK